MAVSPGFATIAAVGGLASFTGWRGRIVPVAIPEPGGPEAEPREGGWRARRLPRLLAREGDLVTLWSPIDGSTHRFSAAALERGIIDLGASAATETVPAGSALQAWTDLRALPPTTGWVVSAVPAEAGRQGAYLGLNGWADIRGVDLAAKGPLVDGCACRSCTVAGAGYLAHLFRQEEITAAHLLGWHNLHAARALVEG